MKCDYFQNDKCDECEILFEIFKSNIQMFLNKNREYFKLDYNSDSETFFETKEKEIELIYENIKRKYDYLEKIKNCEEVEHQKIAFEIEHMIEDNKRKIISFEKQKKENISQVMVQLLVSG